jgi:hypothetical protein
VSLDSSENTTTNEINGVLPGTLRKARNTGPVRPLLPQVTLSIWKMLPNGRIVHILRAVVDR